MKFKVGDKVVDGFGVNGKIQEVLENGCFIDYGDYATYWNYEYINKKKKLPTKNKVWKEQEKEKQAEIQAKNMTQLYCEYLSKIR